jgi:hypothetical protein
VIHFEKEFAVSTTLGMAPSAVLPKVLIPKTSKFADKDRFWKASKDITDPGRPASISGEDEDYRPPTYSKLHNRKQIMNGYNNNPINGIICQVIVSERPSRRLQRLFDISLRNKPYSEQICRASFRISQWPDFVPHVLRWNGAPCRRTVL